MQRLEKVADEFARIAQDVIKERRAVLLAQKLKELRSRLSELNELFRKLPIRQPVEQPTQPVLVKMKRWTAKAILAKARTAGLRDEG